MEIKRGSIVEGRGADVKPARVYIGINKYYTLTKKFIYFH